MAYRASDGKAFGNRQKMTAYNDRISKGQSGKSKAMDASDEREGHEREEHGGSLESKPVQTPEEVDSQNRRGQDPARNPNPGPREPRPNTPTPGIEEAGEAGAPQGVEPDSLEDIGNFVGQHGPATGIEIRHSGGLSHVTSTHGDGSRHISTHPTPHGAHLHAADAAGLNQQMAQRAAQPEMEDQIPGMRRPF